LATASSVRAPLTCIDVCLVKDTSYIKAPALPLNLKKSFYISLKSKFFLIKTHRRKSCSILYLRSVFEVDSSGLVSDIFTGDVDYQWSGSAAFKLSQNSGLVVGSPTWNDCTVEPCRFNIIFEAF
jgi:hypothetical protein